MSGHEKKMRDLVDRLVGMAPPSPPYPGDTTVTRRDASSRTRNPVLLFAGAAAVVLVLAAVPLLLFGGGSGEPIGTQPPGGDTTTTQAPDTTGGPGTSEDTTTTTEPAPSEVSAVVYLVQTPENSFAGNPALVAFLTDGPASADDDYPQETALRFLTHDGIQLPDGFFSAIPAAVEVVDILNRPEEHLIVVDMNEAFLEGAGGLLADFTMLNQLIYTATQLGEIESVQFTVNGQPVTQFGSEGLDISDPLDRASFLDNANLVHVTEPIGADGTVPVIVSGIANVFEATVSLEVVDLDGNVVYEAFANATCGTGCWGGYVFEVDHDFGAEPGVVRVFWHSAEDGEPADVVSVPVSWGEPWHLIP